MIFLPMAIGHYRSSREFPDLRPGIDDEVERIAELLSKVFEARHDEWDLPHELRTEEPVMARLSGWRESTSPTFLVWLGHGDRYGSHTALALTGSEPGNLSTSLAPERLAQIITERADRLAESGRQDFTVLAVEACHAKAFVDQTLGAVIGAGAGAGARFRNPSQVLLIGTQDGEAELGRFSGALSATLYRDFGATKEISLSRFGEAIESALVGSISWTDAPPDLTLDRRDPVIETALTLAMRDDLTRLMTAEDLKFFAGKAQGADLQEISWYFSGRSAELAALRSWLDAQTPGVLAVTGAAGSGKSAVLGQALLQSLPDLRQVLADHELGQVLPPEQRPPDQAFDAAIHARGLTPAAVIARICTALGLPQPPAADYLADQVADLRASLNKSARQGERLSTLLKHRGQQPPTPKLTTLLIDAIDESTDPLVLVDQVIRPLAGIPNVRVIAGLRPSTLEQPDRPGAADHNLLDALRPAQHLVVARDAAAITTYVRRRLEHVARIADWTPLQASHCAQAARLIGQRDAAGGPAERFGFLFAHLAANEIVARPALLDAPPEQNLELAAVLAEDHRGLFARAVARLRDLDPVNETLLHALAFAQGRGMPIENRVWATAAEALTSSPITKDQIDRLCTAAGPYLVSENHGGQTVYRLAHQTFVEHFRTVQDAPIARRIAERLIAVAGDYPDPRLPTYLERHLAGHASEVGGDGWQLLADRTDILDRLDPTSVTVAARGRFTDLPTAIAGVVGAHHLLHALPIGERTGPRQLAMARQPTASNDNQETHPYAQWTIRWAHLTRQPISLTLGGRNQSVNALTVFAGPGGLPRLASASTDHTISLWDPVTGLQVHQLTGHKESVSTLAALRSPDGRTWLISGGYDDTVRIWDPADGRLAHLLKGHADSVAAVTGFTGTHRHMLAASVGHDGTLRIWDPMKGQQLRSVPVDPDGLTAVTAFQDEQGRSYLFAGGNGSISVFDAMTAQQIVRLTGHSNFVSALAVVPGPQGRPILASGSWDKSIKIWDTSTWRQTAHLTGHSDWVRDLAALPAPDGSWLLASAGDSTVRIWDPGSGLERHRFAAHRRIVFALAPLAGPDGHMILASGGDDTLRLWDLSAALESGHEPAAAPRWVDSLAAFTAADGRALLATGGHDGTVQLWDPHTGELLKRHTLRREPIPSIAAFTRPDGRVLLATDTEDLTVGFWEPFTGRLFTRIQVGGNNTIVAFAPELGYSGVVTAGSHVDIWNLTEDRKIHLSQRMTIHVVAAFALPNGKRMVATVNDRTIRLWDADSGRKLGKLPGHRERITALQHLDTPTGTTLLASGGADHQVRIWDPLTRRLIHQITDHTAAITAMAALPGAYGGTLLATADRSGTVLLTDPVSNTAHARLTLGMEITALAALADRALAISGREGVIAVDIHHTRWNGSALTAELRNR